MCFLAYTPSEKRCFRCGISKTWDEFSTDKYSKDGMSCLCRICMQAKNHANYLRHQLKRVSDARQRRITHAGLISIQRRKRYADDPECFRAEKRASMARDPLKERARQQIQRIRHGAVRRLSMRTFYEKNKHLWQEWAQAHPESIRLIAAKRRARKRNLPDTFTLADREFMLQYWGFSCAVCGNQEGLFGLTVADDHWIPLSDPDCPGTIAENIIPLCHGKGGCNNSKHTSDPETWLLSRYSRAQTKRILKDVATYFAVVRARNTQQHAG